MRADRLISILMLLQMHKKLTASELSKKLEVSVRTIYRDIDILSGIGVPIVADGIKLLGDYKTSLTGINKKELFSLLLPTCDKIFEDLGIEDLKYSTMLKILGNSSHNQIEELENIQNYIYIDMYTWNEPNISLDIDILSILQNAVWNSKSLKLLYRKVEETKEIVINPLGLVCKHGIWYLVAVDNEIYLNIKFDSVLQGIEFAFGYGKDIEIIEPIEAISEI